MKNLIEAFNLKPKNFSDLFRHITHERRDIFDLQISKNREDLSNDLIFTVTRFILFLQRICLFNKKIN